MNHLETDLAGEARLHARALTAKSVELDAASDAFAEVCATERLEADVDYYCSPGSVDREVGALADLRSR